MSTMVVDAPSGRALPWRSHVPPAMDQAALDLARHAVAMRLEKVPFEEGVDRLVAGCPDREVLQLARDYLAYTPFEAPLLARSDAVALVDAVSYRLDHEAHRWRPWHRWRART